MIEELIIAIESIALIFAGPPKEKLCPDCNETYYFKHECVVKKDEPKKSNRKIKREKRNKS